MKARRTDRELLLGPVWREPWIGATGDADTDIARMERAAGKVCGWCGEQYEAWMDLDEWVCARCVSTVGVVA